MNFEKIFLKRNTFINCFEQCIFKFTFYKKKKTNKQDLNFESLQKLFVSHNFIKLIVVGEGGSFLSWAPGISSHLPPLSIEANGKTHCCITFLARLSLDR